MLKISVIIALGRTFALIALAPSIYMFLFLISTRIPLIVLIPVGVGMVGLYLILVAITADVWNDVIKEIKDRKS